MSDDDEPRRPGRLGQTLPGYSALAEAFGAAIDGASKLTRTRAKQLAERILTGAGLEHVDLGEAASEAGAKINQLAEEIIAARKANRALLQHTVTAELEKSLSRLGLARADEVAALRSEIAALRMDIAGLTTPAKTAPAAKKSSSKKAAKKAAAEKSASKKATAKKSTAKKSAGADA